MRCPADSYLQVQQFFARDEGALQDRLRGACVTLEAPNFLGAGVLCKIEQDAYLAERAMVATSKSNLLRLAHWDPAQAPPSFTDYAIKALLAAMIAQVQIRHGETLAPIEHLAVFEPAWNHDLLLLLSRDPALIELTRTYGCFAGLEAVQGHRRYYAGNVQRPFRYLQCGAAWDANLTSAPPDLPCRLTDLLEREPQTLAGPKPLGPCKEVYRLAAEAHACLSDGDQGGAVFATFNEKGQAPEFYLHAINLASDTGVEPAFDTATSCRAIIERTYTQLDHGA